MSPWKWSLILLVPAFGWLLVQLSALESRVEALTRSVAQLESREPPVARAQDRGVFVIQPDGGLARGARATGPVTVDGREHGAPTQTAMTGKRAEKRILDVVEREQNRIVDQHLRFHKQRWLDAREEALAKFADDVQLSPTQNSRLDDLVRGEVDHMMEMLREPRFRDDPQAFVDEWDATLAATDHAIQAFLTPEQQEAWEIARAIERAVFFPWLPQ